MRIARFGPTAGGVVRLCDGLDGGQRLGCRAWRAAFGTWRRGGGGGIGLLRGRRDRPGLPHADERCAGGAMAGLEALAGSGVGSVAAADSGKRQAERVDAESARPKEAAATKAGVRPKA